VIENDDRHFCESKLAGGEQTAVTSDDTCLGVNEDWIIKSELGDAGGNLSDLRITVRPRISSERDQPVEQPMLDALDHVVREHTRTFQE
jgi:hypothetical protein